MIVHFFTGHDREPWNPETLKAQGGSGPQVAACEMARYLAMLGHDVSVFGDCRNEQLEGVFDNVQYFDESFYGNMPCDVLVASSRPDAVDESDNTKLRVLWLHDAHVYNALRRERALKMDLYFCLSRWHRDFFAKTYRGYVLPEQIVITRSGLGQTNWNSNRGQPLVQRNPHRVLFTSRPERGLDTILSVWSRVLERVPDAELRLTSYLGVPYGLLPDRTEILGCIEPEALALEYLQAGVWTCPTRFFDTYNMAATEAMAAGCVPVVTPLAGLLDTVGFYYDAEPKAFASRMIQGVWGSDAYRENLVGQLASAMTETTEGERASLMSYARGRFSWADVAKEWTDLFTKELEKKS